MTNHKQFTELDNLSDELLFRMEVLGNGGLEDNIFETHITLTRNNNAGEQIFKETEENIPILSNNLRSVEISKSSEENTKLGLIGLRTLE
jgi:hypothetical protein